MSTLAGRAARTGRLIWSAWAGLAGLSVFAAAWQIGHEAYGSFILPAPTETLVSMAALLADVESWELVGMTASRALLGFAAAAGIGTLYGALAGYHPAIMRLARPQITLLLGVPPIAWIVLLMIWFGNGAATVSATAAVACLPIVFIGAAEGIAVRDRGLEDMARAVGLGPVARIIRTGLRQMLHALFPALVMALGTAFKASIMAELLANAGGVGEELAVARANLDVAAALAWILLSVMALIGVEYGLLHPLRAEFETWREAARPWGVKR